MTVNICGIPHTVIEKEDSFDALAKNFGMIDYDRAEIVINKASHPYIKQETLCHEIVHGILVHIGRQDLSNDETLVQALGNAVNQSFEVRRVTDERDSD